MSAVLDSTSTKPFTLEDLTDRFGALPRERIRQVPAPGLATETDWTATNAGGDVLCELIDGVLLEKAMGHTEAWLATWIATLLNQFVVPRKLGRVIGADGPYRLIPGQIRLPDVGFVSNVRLCACDLTSRILPVAPNLAIEVLSPSNTRREMERKVADYFGAGVELVWLVDPRSRHVQVFSSPTAVTDLDSDGVLSGEFVLPGFELSVAELFSLLDQPEAPPV